VVAPWALPQDPERQSLRAPQAAGPRSADGRAISSAPIIWPRRLHAGRYGSRVSLVIGLAAVLVGGLIGSTLGLLAAIRAGASTGSS